jgi:hypothetical protein
MIRKIQDWLLVKIANGRPVALNLHLKQGLHIDGEKTKHGYFYNVNITAGDFGIKAD